jgi:RNA polymerase sigma-70 factor (ECF subfamily)
MGAIAALLSPGSRVPRVPAMGERASDPRTLVDSASRGDAAAVEELLARYLPGLNAFVRLRAGPLLRARESSSDLVQSVCREVLEHVDRFQYRSEGLFKQWLFTTAARKIADRCDYVKAQRRDVRKEVALDAAPASAASTDGGLAEACRSLVTPSRELIAREEVVATERALLELADDHREVILLARVVGLSAKEIGETMNRSESAVRSLLHRALAELCALVERDLPPAK